ncbi:MAG: Type 1 glutamine amidotransferase-like domain-containing protein [Chloroflexota bacterium]
MILALLGSGEYLPQTQPIDQHLINKLSNRLQRSPNVVCLPTAVGMGRKRRIRYWSTMGIQHFTHLGVPVDCVPVLDRASANNPYFAAKVAAADFVYLSGGRPDYLYHTLDNSLVWQSIQSVISRGGLLAGCSAGGMVLGERFFGLPLWRVGFGLLPNIVVIPHYDIVPFPAVHVVRWCIRNQLTLLGIDSDTALILDEGRCEVMGRGGVAIWTDSSPQYFEQGVYELGQIRISGYG